jgi:hypothetical protein
VPPPRADSWTGLTPLIDQNRDGSILDDVSGIVGRVLGRK